MMHSTVKTRQGVSIFSHDAEILGVHAGMDSYTWRLGLLQNIEQAEFAKALERLHKETDSSNVFLTSAYLKAAVHNLECSNVRFLFLSRQCGNEEELMFFLPVMPGKIGFSRLPVWQSWTHDYANLGTPLVSSQNCSQTIKALSECLKVTSMDKAMAIVIDYLPMKGDFITGLYHSKNLSDRILLANPVNRAGLNPVKEGRYASACLSGKRRQRLTRARRELATMGKLEFEKISEPSRIDKTIEEFMRLEASGWKGKKKTALQVDEDTRKFCAEAACLMAMDDKCRVYTLRLDGKLIAAMIVFLDKGHAYTWKTAFDETYSKQSTGNLLTVFATSDIAQTPGFKHLDSLAAHFNQTAFDFWPDQTEIVSMIIGIGDNYSSNAFQVAKSARRFHCVKNYARKKLKP